MNYGTLIKKHGTSLLGALFVLIACITLFKYTIDRGWITDPMKIGLGLLFGTGLAIAGFRLQRRPIVSQIVMGLGASLLYMTVSFSGIFYGLWDSMTVLLGISVITIAAAVYAYRFDSRLLMNIALLGGLLSPLTMKPETDQVFALFLYLLVINCAFLYLSIVKGWTELRTAAFAGSWLLYTVYFFHFNPSLDGFWSMPIRYALAAFLFYQIAFLVSSWKNKLSFDGLNLYLSVANGVLFGFWALLIWRNDVHFAYPLIFIGLVFMLSGFVVNRLLQKVDAAVSVYWTVGLLLFLLALNQAGNGMEIKPLVNVFVWSIISIVLLVLGRINKWLAANIISVSIWIIVGFYWYIVTWSTPRGEWFGVYIPFLNWGAVAWMVLAAIGFYYATSMNMAGLKAGSNRLLSNIYATLSHLIIGGLLTRQIENIFTEYFNGSSGIYMKLTLTVTWGVYALLLFLWGAYRRESWFRWFGSAVLLLVAVKAIFMDLSGKESLYKVVVLLLLGVISFAISWINGKWGEEEAQKQKQNQAQFQVNQNQSQDQSQNGSPDSTQLP
ncbi:DUF2339 domain-containing protein [Paenibacillus radicis (ex Gao et al. 2016)]|uniref:DUF2339 domain-containing protein n=1 Tax=Paenibacillus radicis (ex Gao et al. 2016) TaxID=1737354 RepID=A0A917HU03_9BACL|nr:DUF2339 domain-containing protein [Paenibacillus radicis (ex Gao et al. 2016)]GGG89150.1 hypothetical protein GCM10010918_54810 [Paenibacillus radicis (ex Gao et al. 2016)]